jgi:hypothetical protein
LVETITGRSSVIEENESRPHTHTPPKPGLCAKRVSFFP